VSALLISAGVEPRPPNSERTLLLGFLSFLREPKYGRKTEGTGKSILEQQHRRPPLRSLSVSAQQHKFPNVSGFRLWPYMPGSKSFTEMVQIRLWHVQTGKWKRSKVTEFVIGRVDSKIFTSFKKKWQMGFDDSTRTELALHSSSNALWGDLLFRKRQKMGMGCVGSLWKWGLRRRGSYGFNLYCILAMRGMLFSSGMQNPTPALINQRRRAAYKDRSSRGEWIHQIQIHSRRWISPSWKEKPKPKGTWDIKYKGSYVGATRAHQPQRLSTEE